MSRCIVCNFCPDTDGYNSYNRINPDKDVCNLCTSLIADSLSEFGDEHLKEEEQYWLSLDDMSEEGKVAVDMRLNGFRGVASGREGVGQGGSSQQNLLPASEAPRADVYNCPHCGLIEESFERALALCGCS